MKTMPAITAICGILVFNACTMGNQAMQASKANYNNSPADFSGCYVQYNNGTIKPFATLKLVKGVLVTPHLLGDEKVVINANDILAYQNEQHFAVSAKLLTSPKLSQVAVETLPGFAIKVLSGKLNVYSRKYYNGSNTSREYFIQSGNDGFILSYSSEALLKLVKEDSKLSELFNTRNNKIKNPRKMLAAVEKYNHSQYMTRN